MEFIPDEKDEGLTVPYYEDASNALGVVGYATNRSEKELRVEIERAMAHLGASIQSFQSGRFGPETGPYRYGYVITFRWQGVDGRIVVAGLPIRNETPSRIEKTKRHALYSVMLKLESQFNSQLVMPGDFPLVPYLLNDKGQSLMEAIAQSSNFPALPEPKGDIEEGEWREA